MHGLTILVEDAAELAAQQSDTNHDFALIRRVGFGASDSSVLLRVNKWKTYDQLIDEKCSKVITDDEKRVSAMVNVRKGSDLEPLILAKFEKEFNVECNKPKPMFKIDEHPQLLVNFDGLLTLSNGTIVPVEVKYASPYATKFWDESKAMLHGKLKYPDPINRLLGADMAEHIENAALRAGIPTYYYTQVQQQILAAEAPFGYLTSMWDKVWELRTFAIPRDEVVIQELLRVSEIAWAEVKRRKGQ